MSARPANADQRSDDRQRLLRLLRAGHVCIAITTLEEQDALQLVREAALELSRPLYVWSTAGGVQEALLTDSPPIPQTNNPADGLAHLATLENRPLCITLDLLPHLRDQHTLRVWRNLLARFRQSGRQLVMIDYQAPDTDVLRSYMTPFELSLPGDAEIETIVRNTLRQVHRQRGVEVDISRRAWRAVVRNLYGLSRRQIERVIFDCITDDRRFDDEDLPAIIAAKRRILGASGLLEFIETPVDTSEIGGLRRLKAWLEQRRSALSDRAAEFGIDAPRGVLMLGVQGAGKSLCAKAIATTWQRPLLRMDVGALYDRYVGESERRLRDTLAQAEALAPIVLWIDEIEKAFASAAAQSTDGGLSKRMFGTLLTWMQEHTAPVFLVATANDIEALPPELLRKGRFDEVFFVDLPAPDVREQIFAIHLKKRQRDPDKFDLAALAAAAEGFSGAEIEQAVIAALHTAFSRHCELTTQHILEAVRNSPPLSVTMAERVEALRRWARGRCVPAD